MNVIGWFTVGLTKGSPELCQALFRIHPEGRQLVSGSRLEYFQCELPEGDPKLQELSNVITDYGYRFWAGRGQPTPQDIRFEYRRKYEKADFEAAVLLQPQPTVYIGTSNRNSDGLLLLSPEDKFAKKGRNGLKGFDIGFTVVVSLVVSSELRLKFESSTLKHLVFKPILNRDNPDYGPIPDYWELTGDYVMPSVANPELREGFYTPVEYHYRASDLSGAGDFDFALTRENLLEEWPQPVVSQRFYRFCVEQKLNMDWEPVRIDSESGTNNETQAVPQMLSPLPFIISNTDPSDAALYELAMNEVQSGKPQPDLWAKAFAEADGEEKKQITLYLKYRVADEKARLQEIAEQSRLAKVKLAEVAQCEQAAWAESARQTNQPNLTQPWTNSLGMKFVPVAGTEVLFGVWDVRVADYRAYASAAGGVDISWQKPDFASAAGRVSSFWKKTDFLQGEAHPVVNVSCNDAQAFCEWLTKKEQAEGKISAGQSYRLPQDWEWSMAVGLNEARGGTPSSKDMKIRDVYPWGTGWPIPKGAGNYYSHLNVNNYTLPVGSFAANRQGLYDMGGNVWQWCGDEYSSSGYRVLRGASWINASPDELCSSSRYYSSLGGRYLNVGFRCVLAS